MLQILGIFTINIKIEATAGAKDIFQLGKSTVHIHLNRCIRLSRTDLRTYSRTFRYILNFLKYSGTFEIIFKHSICMYIREKC